jgi:membrane protease YdiL (CAAX protease family)
MAPDEPASTAASIHHGQHPPRPASTPVAWTAAAVSLPSSPTCGGPSEGTDVSTDPAVSQQAATTESAWTTFWNSGSWWKAVLAVVGYIALYQLAGLGIGETFARFIHPENIFATAASVFLGVGAGLVVGAVLLLGFLVSVGWLRPIFARHQGHGQYVDGRWWMWAAPVVVLVPIVLRIVGIDYASYAPGVVATTFAVGLLIGFTEELLYRGIVVKILRDGGHREWTVAVVSSGLFALSHSVNLLSGQPVLTVGLTVVFTFGFGLMMYLVMRITGSIIWAMVLHALTDPTTMLATGGIDVDTGAAHSPALELASPFNIVFVVVALIALLFIRGRVTPGRPSPSTS